MGGEARTGYLSKTQDQVRRRMNIGQWEDVSDPIAIPYCVFQNMETSCCCIRYASCRRSDMKALYVGEKLVGTKHAEDELKLNDHVPWRFDKPCPITIYHCRLTHHSDPIKASHSQHLD